MTDSLNMPGFVVLRHEMPQQDERDNHFDVMLERDGELLTWALNTWPIGQEVESALQLPAHRIAYLDYEGPVSGERGQVSRVEAGCYETESQVADGELVIELQGSPNAGRYRLVRQSADAQFQRWTWERLS